MAGAEYLMGFAVRSLEVESLAKVEAQGYSGVLGGVARRREAEATGIGRGRRAGGGTRRVRCIRRRPCCCCIDSILTLSLSLSLPIYHAVRRSIMPENPLLCLRRHCPGAVWMFVIFRLCSDNWPWEGSGMASTRLRSLLVRALTLCPASALERRSSLATENHL